MTFLIDIDGDFYYNCRKYFQGNIAYYRGASIFNLVGMPYHTVHQRNAEYFILMIGDDNV